MLMLFFPLPAKRLDHPINGRRKQTQEETSLYLLSSKYFSFLFACVLLGGVLRE